MKSDEQIQADVMAELKWQPFLKASEIGVSVQNGVVTLSGTVTSYAKKIAAERVAKNVEGVRAVAEDIEVRLYPDNQKSDSDLANAILSALKWHTDIQEENLKIKVDNGFVTLEGKVEWAYEKDMVRDAIENLTGVKGIINNIIIVPRVRLSDVRQELRRALGRRARLDARHISVDVEGDKVILSGNVESEYEKKIAERAAWFAPGVKSVVNHLQIACSVPAL